MITRMVWRSSLPAILLGILSPVVCPAQSGECWSGSVSFNSASYESAPFGFKGSITIIPDSPHWKDILDNGHAAFAAVILNQQCTGTWQEMAGPGVPCFQSYSNKRGRAIFVPSDGDLYLIYTTGDFQDTDLGTQDSILAGWEWFHLEINSSQMRSTKPREYYARNDSGELALNKSACAGTRAAAHPQPGTTVSQPAQPAPPSISPENAADQVLSSADQLLATASQLGSQPTNQPARRQTVTYVSFANHPGLPGESDGTWGVGIGGSPNDADGSALANCNTKVSGGAPQCSSGGSCVLATGTWAAYAIATGPLLNTGPYPSGTSCGAKTQAAAQALALRRCQSNPDIACNVVWSGTGK